MICALIAAIAPIGFFCCGLLCLCIVIVLGTAVHPWNRQQSYYGMQLVISSTTVKPKFSTVCPFVTDHKWATFLGWAGGGEIADRVKNSQCWQPT